MVPKPYTAVWPASCFNGFKFKFYQLQTQMYTFCFTP